MKFVITLFG